MMFKIFRKNHTTANIELENNDQMSALKLAAQKAADEFNLDEQTVQSSIFASAAQGNTILEDRAVFMYATSEKKHRVHTILLTFKDPVAWGNDQSLIDYLIVGVFPDKSSQKDVDELTQNITDKLHGSDLDDIKFNDTELNKLNQSFTE
ncbi:PTS sugar transporter subunit IIA [Companilactobacillus halodurans]|uniref:PTS EIIA type-2 domain-containing protein n=1 Tax=Companilactobacillus halodurans TaxID=2584183 RepID=A0A5P0ZPR2_9LACO|nr:PTS sugar transporter subunit IIA [Companilactobacillus halodurans]MQS76188.1 hypothetical protein [Companilactobacillus halodurans]MQS98489.1 hypothetical protein [Companilactobacillus halodurans]